MTPAGRWARPARALLAAGALTACQPPADGGEETPVGAPTMTELRRATYVGLDVADTVTLTDGRWEGQPYVPGSAARPTVSLAPRIVLTGDLDGDGEPEAVAALATATGGSGSLVWAVVMERRGGTIRTTAAIPLGDRVQIRGGAIGDGQLTLDLIEAGQGDPACCPGTLVSRTWTVESGEQRLVAESEPQPWSVAALGKDTWVLRYWDLDVPFADSAQVTVRIDDMGVSGSSGCNSYSAPVLAGTVPGELSFGVFASTRMMCPEPFMNIEARYLDLLGRVTRLSFLAGHLVLSYAAPSGSADGVLLFERQPDSTP